MVTLEAGHVVAGRYRLERPLAQGGMGSVWVATHLQLDAEVAVKFMDPSSMASADARARFEREAKASAQIKSPHVVQVHDYGIENDVPFLAMELFHGEDLGARLRHERRLPLATLAGITTQICKALHRAHDAGVVHRDLKPANVFLDQSSGDEVVKVLDFGIAKAKITSSGKGLVGDATTTGMLLGSPHYMSPEQARASKLVDHRSDLWSLGVILFRALTGRLPFPGSEISDVLVAICADPIPAPSQIAPDLGPEVDTFFLRALARDPAQRFQSAREMASAFNTLAGIDNVTFSRGVTWTATGPAPSSIGQEATLAISDVVSASSMPAIVVTGGIPGAARSDEVVPSSRPSHSGGTLSAAGRSVVAEQSPRSSARWVVGAACAALALVGAVGLLWLRSPGAETPSASAAEADPKAPSDVAAPVVVPAAVAPPEAPAATAPLSASAAPAAALVASPAPSSPSAARPRESAPGAGETHAPKPGAAAPKASTSVPPVAPALDPNGFGDRK